MKRYVSLFFSLCFLYACHNHPDSDITGQWQLNKIDCRDREMFTDSVYYSFHLDVFQIQLRRQNDIYITARAWGMYSIERDSLYISIKEGNKSDVLSSAPVLGWHELGKAYKIEELKKSKLTLSCHDTIYYFRKF